MNNIKKCFVHIFTFLNKFRPIFFFFIGTVTTLPWEIFQRFILLKTLLPFHECFPKNWPNKFLHLFVKKIKKKNM